MKNSKLILSSVAILIAIFVAATYFYKSSKSSEQTQIAKQNMQNLKRDYSYVLGNKDAKVELVEFFDPACGSCAYFHPYVKQIMEKNKGKIKLVFRYAPFHKNSNYAVKMLEGARQQGKFLEALEYMYKTQGSWVVNHVVNPQILYSLLANIDLDMDKMAEFMNKDDGDKIIIQDLKDTEKLNITKTPSYYVNGKPLETFSVKSLEDLINSEL
ncbi:MAG: DsbA family protein [Halarcobacter sp.]